LPQNSVRIVPLENRGISSSIFSEELIQKIINVFQKEDGVLLSREKAIEALDSFADLYLAFAGNGFAGRFDVGGSGSGTAPPEPL
jgi:hypothetical protein